jgi:hypothetical protein
MSDVRPNESISLRRYGTGPKVLWHCRKVCRQPAFGMAFAENAFCGWVGMQVKRTWRACNKTLIKVALKLHSK